MTTPEKRFPWYLSGICALILLIGSALGGCSCPPVHLTCPPLVQYSPQEQAVLAAELRAHPELREVPVFLTDYGNERAECRAMQEQKWEE